ncbi:hypothetical protein [Campylobacter coli]|uniref:hypothetical protein n=1 Tax=Campylobacter coli TaxID=195 RepID=UPI00380C165D
MTQEQKISFFKIKRLSIYIFFCALYNFFYFFSYENVGSLHCEFLCISGRFLCFFSWIYIVLAFIFILENKILFLGLLALFFVFYFLFSLTLASLFKEVKMSFYFVFLCMLLAFLFFEKLSFLFFFLALHFLTFAYAFDRYETLKKLY